jgi:hypothetical protein
MRYTLEDIDRAWVRKQPRDRYTSAMRSTLAGKCNKSTDGDHSDLRKLGRASLYICGAAVA